MLHICYSQGTKPGLLVENVSTTGFSLTLFLLGEPCLGLSPPNPLRGDPSLTLPDGGGNAFSLWLGFAIDEIGLAIAKSGLVVAKLGFAIDGLGLAIGKLGLAVGKLGFAIGMTFPRKSGQVGYMLEIATGFLFS